MKNYDLIKLQKKYNDILNEYAKFFCEMIGFDVAGSYFSGTVFCVGDYFIDFKTIKYVVDNQISEDIFFKWYDYNLYLAEIELDTVRIEDFIKGNRKYTNDDLLKLKNAKMKVVLAKKDFENLLENIKKENEKN